MKMVNMALVLTAKEKSLPLRTLLSIPIDEIIAYKRDLELDEYNIYGGTFFRSGDTLYSSVGLQGWEGETEELTQFAGINAKEALSKLKKVHKGSVEIPKTHISAYIYAYVHALANNDCLDFVQRAKFPKGLQTIKACTLYRGIKVSEKSAERFNNGKAISLKNTPVSSWSTHQKQAIAFAEPEFLGYGKWDKRTGFVLTMPSKSASIILNLNDPFFKKVWLEGEGEVIVKGPGLTSFTKNDVLQPK